VHRRSTTLACFVGTGLLVCPLRLARWRLAGFKVFFFYVFFRSFFLPSLGHEFIAVLLETNELLLRLKSDGVLLAKHLPLSGGPLGNVRAMSFDRSAQWLMLVCDDLSIGLLPVFFLMRGASFSSSQAKQKQQQQQAEPRPQEPVGAEKFLRRLGLVKSSPSSNGNGAKLPFSDLEDLTVLTPRVSGRSGATGCIWW
jgi:hypothetical protein